MKKVLFSFAIVAAGLLMASCGNQGEKNAQNAESTESAAVEAPAQEQSAEASSAEASATAECKNMTIAVPAGLKINENVTEADENLVLLDAPELGEFESIRVKLDNEYKSAQEMLDQYYNGNESTWKKADDVTIGSYTFKKLDAIDSADENCILFADANGGVLKIDLSKNVPADAPSVKAVVENIVIK